LISIRVVDLNNKITYVSFGLWNRPLEWNDYFYGITILLFDRDLFLGIVIPINNYSLTKRNTHSSKKMRGIAIP